ncbi:MAG TPA: hypothetical protein VFV99_28995 [Kofleriaceae bacterium]|nr:hypothetical protein [Kofleriaceae bacterium]
MVKLAARTLVALGLVALTPVAAAHPPPPDDYVESEPAPVVDTDPAFNMFGFRMSAGALPLDGGRTTALSIGLGVEHPVFKKTRVFGEYEWLWLTWMDDRALTSMAPRPERHGTGHRASLGLRRELLGKNLGRSVRVFIDGELGATFALVDDNMRGVSFVPGGLGGLRFGYDIYSRSDDSPSRTFEIELLARAVAIEGGVGGMMGLGMAWGN